MTSSLAPIGVRYAPKGMVCAPDHLASQAGLAMLRQGGSACDAAIAANAVLAVTAQQACGLGGDLWAVVQPSPGQGVVALNASGHAGSGADPARLREQGHRSIPAVGHIAAVPIPGCVDGWLGMHERFGLLGISTVLEPALTYAREGFPASPSLALAARSVAHLPGASDYRVDGKPVVAGQLVRRPGMARALLALSTDGRDGHYLGEFGNGLLAIGNGEYHPDDLLRRQAEWVEPIRVDAWGHAIWSPPPGSQAYLALAGAWIAAGLDLPKDPDDPLWAHLPIEASRQAGHDRLEVLHEAADGRLLVDPARLQPRLDAIALDRASKLGCPTACGDTVAICALDSHGQAVSLLQSNASAWGSGLILSELGIFLHNRGQGFSLQPAHPAEYGPGRRPPHTLSPVLVTDLGGNKATMVLGTMGGDSQPQILLQLLARTLQLGQEPPEAMAAGRFVLKARNLDGASHLGGFETWTSGGKVTVAVEGQAPLAWLDGLEQRGHKVTPKPAFADEFGHAQLIVSSPDCYGGASDPRSDGAEAAGW